MKVSIKGNKMIVEVDMESNPSLSSSGKNIVVATSHGTIHTNTEVKGKPVKVSLNAFVSA